MTAITTARLIIRDAREPDRAGLIESLCDPIVKAHLGGPKSRADAEASLPAVFRGDKPQSAREAEMPFPEASCVITDRTTGQFMGTTGLLRREPTRPGHVLPEGNELELSYVLLPEFWGKGYAEEATRALLTATAQRHTDEPVIVITQSSNVRSIGLLKRLGFVEREQLELHGAKQTLAVAALNDFRLMPDTS